MKKFIFSILMLIISVTQTNAQAFSNELGGSGIISVMNTNYGYVPGMGAEVKHRLNFLDTHFSLKNSFGMTSYAMTAYDVGDLSGGRIKGQDYLWMFDIIGEFSLLSNRDFIARSKQRWTPYAGIGANFIYRSSKSFSKIEASRGAYITLKGSLGIKYKLQKNILLNIESSFDWDFSDDLDGLQYNTDHWYNYDHIGKVSVGISYLLNSAPRNSSAIWSNL